MKRRDFIKTTALAGLAGAAHSCSSMERRSGVSSGPGFDVHPFVKANPDAVFVHRTSLASQFDTEGIHDTAYRLSRDLIVPVESGGWPLSTRITVKPNWTSTRQRENAPIGDILGVNTDPHFMEGWLHAMRDNGSSRFFIRECASPRQWEPMGYRAIADRNGWDLTDLSTKNFWELGDGINLIDIPDGVVFKKMGFMAPMNESGTFLVNIAKMKAHGMGITASVKNLQGITGRRFHQFCTAYDKVRNGFEPQYRGFLKNDFESHIEQLYGAHVKKGLPRWGRPGDEGGIWQEQWVQRMLDSYSVTPTGINIVEGIYSQDGNGFGNGPHERGTAGFTSRDYLSNIVVFGIDPFRVDIVTHWLAGHEPGNFGLFHLGIERGMSDVLDPHDIPVYNWQGGNATVAKLEDFPRTPLVTYFLQRDWAGQQEPEFHLCDEPFDYTAWKEGKPMTACTPSIEELGRDHLNRRVFGLSLPERDRVYMEILNSRGERLWRMRAPDLAPGTHQVVWDGFASPGLYNVYVKGMGWDAKRQVVVWG